MHQTQCQALGYRIKIHRSYPQRNQRKEQKKTLLRIQRETSQQKYYEGAKEGHLHQTRTEAGGS